MTIELDHSIEVTAGRVVRFVCDAEEQQPCRRVCALDCEEVHRPGCDGTTVSSPRCIAIPSLTSDDAVATYNGVTDPSRWTSGAVDVEWDGYYDSWLWRYPGEDRGVPGELDPRRAVRAAGGH